MFVCLLSLKCEKWQSSDKKCKLVTLTSFARYAIEVLIDMWKIAISYERGKDSVGKCVTCLLVLGFDVVTSGLVGDIARALLVLSGTINIWGGAQSIEGFATLKNVINLLVTSEVRPDISKSVLSKSRLHAFMEKNLGTEICIKFEWRDFDYRRLLQQEWFERGRSKNRYGRLCCVKTNRFGKR